MKNVLYTALKILIIIAATFFSSFAIVKIMNDVRAFSFVKNWETLFGALVSIPITLLAIYYTNKVTREAAQTQIQAIRDVSLTEINEAKERDKQSQVVCKNILIQHLKLCSTDRYILVKDLDDQIESFSISKFSPEDVRPSFKIRLFPSELFNHEFLRSLDSETLNHFLEAWSHHEIFSEGFDNLYKGIIPEKNDTNKQEYINKAFLVICANVCCMEQCYQNIYETAQEEQDLLEVFSKKVGAAKEALDTHLQGTDS